MNEINETTTEIFQRLKDLQALSAKTRKQRTKLFGKHVGASTDLSDKTQQNADSSPTANTTTKLKLQNLTVKKRLNIKSNHEQLRKTGNTNNIGGSKQTSRADNDPQALRMQVSRENRSKYTLSTKSVQWHGQYGSTENIPITVRIGTTAAHSPSSGLEHPENVSADTEGCENSTPNAIPSEFQKGNVLDSDMQLSQQEETASPDDEGVVRNLGKESRASAYVSTVPTYLLQLLDENQRYMTLAIVDRDCEKVEQMNYPWLRAELRNYRAACNSIDATTRAHTKSSSRISENSIGKAELYKEIEKILPAENGKLHLEGVNIIPSSNVSTLKEGIILTPSAQKKLEWSVETSFDNLPALGCTHDFKSVYRGGYLISNSTQAYGIPTKNSWHTSSTAQKGLEEMLPHLTTQPMPQHHWVRSTRTSNGTLTSTCGQKLDVPILQTVAEKRKVGRLPDNAPHLHKIGQQTAIVNLFENIVNIFFRRDVKENDLSARTHAIKKRSASVLKQTAKYCEFVEVTNAFRHTKKNGSKIQFLKNV